MGRLAVASKRVAKLQNFVQTSVNLERLKRARNLAGKFVGAIPKR